MTVGSTIPVVGGVDTHARTHTAAVIDLSRRVLATRMFPATSAGYAELLAWMTGFGTLVRVGVEGTGSYGAGLTRFLTGREVTVREVMRQNRQRRRRHGKSDPVDAISAALAALVDDETATPRSLSGPVETLRNLRVARRSLVAARTRLVNQIHALVVTAPADLREHLDTLTTHRMIRYLADSDPAGVDADTAGVLMAAAPLARIHIQAGADVNQLTADMRRLVEQIAPRLLDIKGYGPVNAADLIITAGSNPDRLGSEASFAALCGVSPVEASSGPVVRHRINRGGDRQANAALYRAVIVRLRYDPDTRAYMQRRLTEGKTKRDIIRALKRSQARTTWRILTANTT